MSVRPLLKALLVARTSHPLAQFFRYGLVGGVAAAIDIGLLYTLTSVVGMHYLMSVAIAFLCGVTVNYLLSIAWVFTSSGRRKAELSLFVLIGLGGLGLSELIVWALVEGVSMYYLAAKLVAMAMVLFWNFGLRRMMFQRLASTADQESAK